MSNSIYNTKQFKQLRAEWYSKLAKSGFKDLEDKHENLYQPDTRTIAWRNQDCIRSFFMKLDRYLHVVRVAPRHKRILTLWSQGTYVIDIHKKTGVSLRTIHDIIARYKQIVLNWQEDA